MPRQFLNYCLNYVSSGSGNVSCKRDEMLFFFSLGAGETMSVLHAAVVVRVQNRPSRLLGGKGLGGGPDETERSFHFLLTYTFMYREKKNGWTCGFYFLSKFNTRG